MFSQVRAKRQVRAVALAIAFGSTVFGFPSSARAADPVRVPTRLDWGASVCGDAQGFASRVLQRTQRVRFVDEAEDLTVHLSIEPEGTGLEARVDMRAAGRQLVTRRIASPDCDDALDALALVVAISLEARSHELERIRATPRPQPRARPQPAPSAPLPAPEPPSSPPDEAPPTAAFESTEVPAAAPVPEPELPAPTSSPPAAEPPPPPVVVDEAPAEVAVSVPPEIDVQPGLERGEGREGLWFSAGVSANMAFAVTPDPLIGAGGWLSASWERGSIWSPAIRVGFSHVRLDGLVRPEGASDFVLNTGDAELCPMRVAVGNFELRPCVAGSVGRLSSKGRESFFNEDATRPWRALGGSLQALAFFGPLEVRANLLLQAPLIRDSFRYGPPCTGNACEAGIFYRVSSVTTQLGLGAGVRF